MRDLPPWAWLAIGVIVAALLVLLTGHDIAGIGGAAPVLVERRLRRARELRDEAAEVIDDGPGLDEAEREGIDEMAARWRNGGGL